MSKFPRENYVVCKIIRQRKSNELGIVSDMNGYHIGPLTQVTDVDKVTDELSPLFQEQNAVSNIECTWRICAVSVVGGIYCDIDENKEILNPVGIISAPSPGHKYGTIDYARPPNGLVFQLGLSNVRGEKCQIAYFDRELNIKTNILSHRHEIKFNKDNTDVPKLNIFLDPYTTSSGWFFSKKFTNFARKPLGAIPCYRLEDIEIC